ncbi:MAG: Ribose ABC transport system, ATP-binding protein RbsA [uncultured Phycisphaerae bacterium]|uniref:Ribose ABC transport system, ATP-binding protein RbsA n=1 Tax=uncultured Phycisphaerae bacterium TaxID=904963 RepID=A0A6J4Q8Y7_9BACT|nr:MAG: Ribose ABC transport system, ATP-binding protein RbsA [uncultured Phycisphaerae bacterium]
MSSSAAPILEFRQIAKAFFGVPVLKGVSFAVPTGGVLGLVGENGAGKSTLMNILGGVLQPDGGEMLLAGEPYAPADARAAGARGVAFIHQELNLFPNLTVAENLHLPTFPTLRLGPVRLPLVDRTAMRRRAAALLAAVDLAVPPDALVERLSPGERQLVEIAKAVGADARLVIFDEPTTSLTAREADRLFALVARLRGRGVSMVYISHQLGDVRRLCDEVVVLRDGQVVGRDSRDAMPIDRMITLMVGRSIEQLYPARSAGPRDEVVLEARDVTRAGVLHGVSLSLRRGEVLGLSGLMGAGRTELARALFGLDRIDAGEVWLRGAPHRPTPAGSVRAGMAFLTEDRRAEGLMMDASIADNAAMVALPRFAATPFRWVRRRALRAAAAETTASVRLAGAAVGRQAGLSRQAARTLSGGNQQKVVLAKWLMNKPDVFLLDEPTRGVDVGAKHEIYRLVNALAEQGAGVLMISSELEELIGMCDRILVMSAGRLTGELHRAGGFDRAAILRAALGGGAGDQPGAAGAATATATATDRAGATEASATAG